MYLLYKISAFRLVDPSFLSWSGVSLETSSYLNCANEEKATLHATLHNRVPALSSIILNHFNEHLDVGSHLGLHVFHDW